MPFLPGNEAQVYPRVWVLGGSGKSRAEYVGDVALAAGDYDQALEAFRSALRSFARSQAGVETRARVYRKVGQTEERRGHPDRAYDAYLKAIELNPEEAHARERVAAMERAAGFE